MEEISENESIDYSKDKSFQNECKYYYDYGDTYYERRMNLFKEYLRKGEYPKDRYLDFKYKLKTFRNLYKNTQRGKTEKIDVQEYKELLNDNFELIIYNNGPYIGYIYPDNEYFTVPKNINLEGVTSLAYLCSGIYYEAYKNMFNYWDTSKIINWTECFSGTVINSEEIVKLDFSSGEIFNYAFSNTKDEDDNGFKYFRNLDISKGKDYTGMFKIDNLYCYHDRLKDITFDYSSLAKMKVNPEANFNEFFFELKPYDAEHFRNWFPDLSINEIVEKLTFEDRSYLRE